MLIAHATRLGRDMDIDKNVPIPLPGGRRKYPWAEMEVGDSVLLEGFHSTAECYPYRAALNYAAYWGLKFTARAVEGGVRIWRIE